MTNEFRIQDVLASYDRLAGEIVPDYESLDFEKVHPATLDLLPPPSATILDVGAGTGRDAAWFARLGHRVLAVEPSRELRRAGQALHESPAITWIDDCLPDLSEVCGAGSAFDLIWLSAMCMHVPPDDRARAFRTLVSLLNPGGGMMFSLRLGPLPNDRPMAPVCADEIRKLAKSHGLGITRTSRYEDAARRNEISWEMVFVR